MANTTIDTLQLDIVVNSNTATSNLKKTTNEINNLNNSIKGTKKGGGLSNIGKSLNFGAMIGKLYFIRNITKRLSDNLAKMVQYGIDFTETLNLWQTAMRGNIGEARTFIAEMNKAYGIAEATLMKYQATFKNMLSAMGKISEDTAYGLSEALTKMALDFSSLYNVSIESAMQKFQAVLSGQVRPIRSISGYDITENTIFDLYKGLGGTKTMRQLDQTEKRLLRIYAVFQQMSGTGALGDLEKTLTTNSNQLRIMKEQAIEFATWIGNGLSYLMQESGVLIKINTLLFTAKEIAKSLAYELGYSEENFISGIFDDATNANDAVDELQGKLLGFDKFQTLQDTGTSDVSIEDALLNAIKEYQSLLSGAVNPAQKESVKLLERMGFVLTEIVDKETGALVKVWELADGSKSLLDIFNNIKNSVLVALPLLIGLKSPLFAILTFIEFMAINNKEFGKGIVGVLKQVLRLLNPISKLLSALLLIIDPIFDILGVLLQAITPILNIIIDIVDFVADIILGIVSFLSKYDLLKVALVSLITIIGMLWAMLSFNPIGLIIIGITGLITAIALLVNQVVENWTQIKDFFVGLWDSISIGFMKLINTITNGFISFINLIIRGLNHILNPINNVSEFFGGKKIEIGYISSIDWGGVGNFANGGGFNSADLFYANENGQTEIIASNNRGGGAVMNMEQLQTAITRGMLVAMASNESNQQINLNVNVGNENWFNITRKVAQQNGYDLVKVR